MTSTGFGFTTLLVLKYLGIVTAAIFGILGAAFDTREGDKINRWGIVAIIGVIAGALLGSAMQTVEADIKRQDDARAKIQARNLVARQVASLERLTKLAGMSQQTLNELNTSRAAEADILQRAEHNLRIGEAVQRISTANADSLTDTIRHQAELSVQQQELLVQSYRQLTPLEPVWITYEIEYPATAPVFASYIQRVQARQGNHSTIASDNSDFDQVTTSDDRLAHDLLARADITLRFYRGLGLFRLGPDLALSAPAPCKDKPEQTNCIQDSPAVSVEVELDRNVIRKTVGPLRLFNYSKVGYSTIVSQIDLIGSDVVIVIDGYPPVATKLTKIQLWSGRSNGDPATIDFSDIPGTYEEIPEVPGGKQMQFVGRGMPPFSLEYRKKLTSRDLWVRVVPD